jgi:hypothetical protein
MNDYFKDSLIFFQKAASIIDESNDFNQMVESTLHFALGVERILKGILWDINNLYVFIDPSFSNSAPILYHEKIFKKKNQEIKSTPSADVITYKLSLLRARAFSRVTRQFSGLLFALSEYRDIIAHRPLSELNSDKLKKLLFHDFIFVVREFSEELQIPLTDFIGNTDYDLRYLAEMFGFDVNYRMKEKIEFFKEEWGIIKNDPEQMKALKPVIDKYSGIWYMESIKCPACENNAFMSIETEYERIDGEAVATRLFPTGMQCRFCGFKATDYEEIDYLRLSDQLDWNLEADD